MTLEEMLQEKEKFVPHESTVPTAMTVENIISMLEVLPKDKYVLIDFGYKAMFSDFVTDSWRGSYEYPAIFETEKPYTVKECLSNLKLTDGKEVIGYKGGDFILSDKYELYVETEYSTYSSTGIIGITENPKYIVINTLGGLY